MSPKRYFDNLKVIDIDIFVFFCNRELLRDP